MQHGLHYVFYAIKFIEFRKYDDEFVPALSSYSIGSSYAPLQTQRSLLKQDIPHVVTQGIVNLFEMIQIDEEQSEIQT